MKSRETASIMNPPTSPDQPWLSRHSRNRLILLASVLGAVAVVIVVIIMVRPPTYRYQLPSAWSDACLGDPEVISDVFSASPFSKANITHDNYEDRRWYQCSWKWETEGTGGWRQSIDLKIEVLDGNEYNDYDALIETHRSESTFEVLRVDEIHGFDSGYCTSSISFDDMACYAVDSNLKVSILTIGGISGEIGESGIAVEDYLAEVGAYIQDQLAR